jgi:hypothetical protein
MFVIASFGLSEIPSQISELKPLDHTCTSYQQRRSALPHVLNGMIDSTACICYYRDQSSPLGLCSISWIPAATRPFHMSTARLLCAIDQREAQKPAPDGFRTNGEILSPTCMRQPYVGAARRSSSLQALPTRQHQEATSAARQR